MFQDNKTADSAFGAAVKVWYLFSYLVWVSVKDGGRESKKDCKIGSCYIGLSGFYLYF